MGHAWRCNKITLGHTFSSRHYVETKLSVFPPSSYISTSIDNRCQLETRGSTFSLDLRVSFESIFSRSDMKDDYIRNIILIPLQSRAASKKWPTRRRSRLASRRAERRCDGTFECSREKACRHFDLARQFASSNQILCLSPVLSLPMSLVPSFSF